MSGTQQSNDTSDDTTAGDAEDVDVGETTTSTAVRWTYLGSVLSFIVLLTFVALVSAGATDTASLESIPQPWFLLFATVVTTAAGWVFGTDLYDMYKGLR